MLVQSYMPAQEIHVLNNPDRRLSPWCRAGDLDKLDTPEWIFHWSDLKRFAEKGCP
ncbi:MAG: hypothetical protein IPP68_03670 [Elusimicrobia bacterium]|nr:hypothetical protein [Elusimicrobiota bacterium]